MKTTSELATQLGIDRWQIARYCHRYKIGKRIGTQWLISEADEKKIIKLRAAHLLKPRTGKRKRS